MLLQLLLLMVETKVSNCAIARCTSPLHSIILLFYSIPQLYIHTYLAVVGSNVSFSCTSSPGLVLTGPFLNAGSVSTSCDAVVAAVASSVTVFILSSVLFFIVGYACGYFGQWHKQSTTSRETSDDIVCPGEPQPAPVYEEILAGKPMPEDCERDFELKENIAYDPVQTTTS